MPLPREQSAGYLVNHLGRQFAVLLANRLKPLGLAPAQHAVLLAEPARTGEHSGNPAGDRRQHP